MLETRNLRFDRITNYLGLPGTKVFPQTWTYSAKIRTVPGKPGWLVTLDIGKGLREFVEEGTIKVNHLCVDL